MTRRHTGRALVRVRWLPVVLLLLTVAVALVQWTPSHADPPLRPNVILIMTDDQGWGDLGVTGHKELRTPRLDQLAGEGALAAVVEPSSAGQPKHDHKGNGYGDCKDKEVW